MGNRWNEKRVMTTYYKMTKGDRSEYDKAPEYVKDYVDQIDTIIKSDLYDNVTYITEFIRDSFVGEVINLFGVRYVSVDRGRPVGKFVAAKVDGKIGFGYSKVDNYEEIPINLIGNHNAFMMARNNAENNVKFEDFVKSSKLDASQKKQLRNFFLRAYRYFKLEDDENHKKTYESILSNKKFVPETLKRELKEYLL